MTEFGTFVLRCLVCEPTAAVEKNTSLAEHSYILYMSLENYRLFCLLSELYRMWSALNYRTCLESTFGRIVEFFFACWKPRLGKIETLGPLLLMLYISVC